MVQFSKPEVRQIAASLGLKTAFKKDSQDICFCWKKDYRNFVSKRIDVSSKGLIVDKDEMKWVLMGVYMLILSDKEKEFQAAKVKPNMLQKIDVEKQ